VKYNPDIVRAYFAERGLPPVSTEFKFASHIRYEDKRGIERSRQWAFDFAWPIHKIALEVEGGIWLGGGHNRGRGMTKDMRKYNTATILGWRIIRVEPKEICMAETVNMIRALML
jgi:hypothetical protein